MGGGGALAATLRARKLGGQWAVEWAVGSGYCALQQQKQSARRRARASPLHRGLLEATRLPCALASQKLNCAERAERISLSSGRFSGLGPLAGSQKLLFCWLRWGSVPPGFGEGGGVLVLGGLLDVLVRIRGPGQRCSHATESCEKVGVRTNWRACGWAGVTRQAGQTDGQPCSRGSHVWHRGQERASSTGEARLAGRQRDAGLARAEGSVMVGLGLRFATQPRAEMGKRGVAREREAAKEAGADKEREGEQQQHARLPGEAESAGQRPRSADRAGQAARRGREGRPAGGQQPSSPAQQQPSSSPSSPAGPAGQARPSSPAAQQSAPPAQRTSPAQHSAAPPSDQRPATGPARARGRR